MLDPDSSVDPPVGAGGAGWTRSRLSRGRRESPQHRWRLHLAPPPCPELGPVAGQLRSRGLHVGQHGLGRCSVRALRPGAAQSRTRSDANEPRLLRRRGETNPGHTRRAQERTLRFPGRSHPARRPGAGADGPFDTVKWSPDFAAAFAHYRGGGGGGGGGGGDRMVDDVLPTYNKELAYIRTAGGGVSRTPTRRSPAGCGSARRRWEDPHVARLIEAFSPC